MNFQATCGIGGTYEGERWYRKTVTFDDGATISRRLSHYEVTHPVQGNAQCWVYPDESDTWPDWAKEIVQRYQQISSKLPDTGTASGTI